MPLPLASFQTVPVIVPIRSRLPKLMPALTPPLSWRNDRDPATGFVVTQSAGTISLTVVSP